MMVNYDFGARFPFRGLHGRRARDTITDLERMARTRPIAGDYDGHAAAALAFTLMGWAQTHPHGSWAVRDDA